MNRVFWLIVLTVATALSADYAQAGTCSFLAGPGKMGSADDGTYWNRDKDHEIKHSVLAFGLRCDTDQTEGGYSLGLQLLNGGTTFIKGIASTADWHEAGGYDPKIGRCIGPCAPLGKWEMQSEVNTLSLIALKHWGAWSIGGGVNLYEIKTSGQVGFPDGHIYRYNSSQYMDFGAVVEAGYKQGPWSVRVQVMPMEGRGAVPSTFTGVGAYALIGRNFWSF